MRVRSSDDPVFHFHILGSVEQLFQPDNGRFDMTGDAHGPACSCGSTQPLKQAGIRRGMVHGPIHSDAQIGQIRFGPIDNLNLTRAVEVRVFLCRILVTPGEQPVMQLGPLTGRRDAPGRTGEWIQAIDNASPDQPER